MLMLGGGGGVCARSADAPSAQWVRRWAMLTDSHLLLCDSDAPVRTSNTLRVVRVVRIVPRCTHHSPHRQQEARPTTAVLLLGAIFQRMEVATAAADMPHVPPPHVTTFCVLPEPALQLSASPITELRGPPAEVDRWLANLWRAPLERTLLQLHGELHLTSLLTALRRVLPQHATLRLPRLPLLPHAIARSSP